MRWLKHAFALDPAGPAEPTEAQRAVVERVCREVVRRHLDAWALVALESCRPLHYLGAQALYLVIPLASVLWDSRALAEFAAFLERRGSIDYLCTRIEALRQEPSSGTRAAQAAAASSGESRTFPPSCPPPAPHEPPASRPAS
jgi:hypothetical protein